ncbi:Transposon Ty3-I Gag-Pol polyprotein [Vitis vinifera]|uniref:Transposon Ty3-I Gag-Pol polyprotein n=1 Tax=Vitis vinifera TaxID=29760 RepID=A0A438CST0_VITVI|nr:Transposon Ty3-I Gag-Pol polyprotein [Vitis vinifera]
MVHFLALEIQLRVNSLTGDVQRLLQLDFTLILSLMQLAMVHALTSTYHSRKSYLEVTYQRLARGKLVHFHGWKSLALPSVGPAKTTELCIFALGTFPGNLSSKELELQLSDGAPDTSFPVAITPTSPDRASMLSLCFPEEITSDGVIFDPTEHLICLGSTIEVFEGTQTLPVPELPEDDSSLFEGIVSPVEGASDLVDPPLSFDVLSGFVSRSDDVSVASFMDLSIFEYSPVSCDSISTSAPHSPITQIFDIDDEIAQPSSDRDSFDHDSGPIDERVSPAAGDVETVDFGTEDQPRELKIGSPLSTDERDRLIHLLRSYLDVFAWSYEDMPGLDPSIVKEEIQKQLSVGFISVVEYPEWLANVVPVPKKDGKVRVCVDFRDLNKASPKDDFPLPHIDLLVDGTAGHSMLSFMDGFSGYNQILMAPEDMEKTAFITEWGTYCYRVMPFGLKNAGATYQRAATTLFHDMMHRDVEVYVDDMIVKSRGRADHLDALERFFERIRKFRLRLNPKKCTFGVTSGKLLGHMSVSGGHRGRPR